MNVVLVTSPHVRHGAVLQTDFQPDSSVMYTFAPVGLLSLLAEIRGQLPAVDAILYDLNRRILSGAFRMDESLYRAIAREIVDVRPDVVGIMTECDSYHHVLQIAREIKSMAFDCQIVLGGPHASAVARHTLERCDYVDAIVVGEGERSFIELIRAIGERGAVAAVPGAMARGPHGVVSGGAAALIESLDDLPIPAYTAYSAVATEEIFVEVGRGCPFQCTFCSTAPYWRRRHRVKSAARIGHEIEHVQLLYGTRRVHFTHDLFTTKRSWVVEVCNELLRRGTPVRWTCSARTDTVDRELLDLMATAGCAAIYFGIESGSERILREIKKDIPFSRSLEVLETCKSAGITPNAGFIVGFPTEDRQSFVDTMQAYEDAVRIGCKPSHLFTFCPFADSSMYRELKSLECNGHFVDLPLGKAADSGNRAMIASDPELFGAYFRPNLQNLFPESPGALAALDEFSPLIEATLVPSLRLADLLGGMDKLFLRWESWIRAHNLVRGAEALRQGYGSVANFAEFLQAELVHFASAEAELDVAKALATTAAIGAADSNQTPTSMATYRSIRMTAPADVTEMKLGAVLVRNSVVAMLSLDHDVSAALKGDLDAPIPRSASHLVWHEASDGTVRLLSVDSLTFSILEDVARPTELGKVVLKALSGLPNMQGEAEIDPEQICCSIAAAAEQDLVRIVN